MWHKHIMVFWFQNTVNPLQVRNWNSEHVCPLVFRGLNYNCIRPHAVLCWVAQLCLTLCDPMDCSPPGSSVHGILQARILEWVAMPSSRGSSQPRDRTQVCGFAGRFFTVWDTRETQEYWRGLPCPPPGDLPYGGIEPGSPALQADSLPAELPGKPIFNDVKF